jgi:hypothetical protein
MTAEPTARDGWDAADAEQRIAYLRRVAEGRAGIFPYGPTGPQAWEEQGIYTLIWQDSGLQVELDLLATDSHGETHAEIAVYWTDPLDPLAVLRTRVTLSSLTGRDRLAVSLAKRTASLELDWPRILDQAARWALEHYRRGEPGLLLRDAPEMAVGPDALTDPPVLETDGLSFVFGDGGSLKSWSALAFAASLAAGESYIGDVTVNEARRVGYLDWEWIARRHRRRMAQLTGADMPDVAYLRCTRPLHEERDRVRRFVRDFGLDYLVVDSVGLACGGEPESAEVAIRFFNTFAALAPAGLGVAHVTKAAADKAPDKPFGSAYWHNSARRTWYVRAVNEPGASTATVGLYNRKANDGPLAHPFALAFEWAGERVTIQRQDVRDVPELDAGRSVPARLRDLLGRRGQTPLYEIVEELGVNKDTAKKALQRGPFVSLAGPDGIYRWALAAPDHD